MDNEQIHQIANIKSAMSLTQLQVRYKALEKLDVLGMSASPGSKLWKINSRSEGIFISQLDDLFQFAMEGMETAFHIKDNSNLPRSSMYVLIRSSIEASAHADWLMSMDNDKEVVYESLRIVRDSIVNSHKVFKGSTWLSEKMEKERLFHLDYLGEKMKKMYPNRKPGARVNYSSIVTNCDVNYEKDMGRREFYSGLAAWEMCSAITHGNQAMLYAVAGDPAERASQRKTNGSEYQNDRLAGLTLACIPAIENLEYLVSLREKYSSN